MTMKYSFEIVVLLLFFLSIKSVNGNLPPKIFDVTKYGAVANGKIDNTQVFLKAWRDACNYVGRSRILIPKGTYLLGSVSFIGPCKGSIIFVIKGILKAPTDPSTFFTDTWIGFRYLNNLVVKGGGFLNGQGSSAWKYNDCQRNPQCKNLPVTMRFDFVKNSRIQSLKSINSKNSHFNLFACSNMNISNVKLTAPADSPNTDGIHIGTSSKIKISHAIISTGDDCISMVAGSQNIDISDVSCGPGHGISIGSLGRSLAQQHVKGINVRNCTFTNTDNGVRIKTWSPSLYSVASDMTFENIIMNNVRNPVVIDQQYCPAGGCPVESKSSVQINDVTFSNIRGTSSTKVVVNLLCSRILPCKNVKLIDINLAYLGPGGPATSMCSHVIGSSHGKQIPGGCL
ncbi:hypothetical protein RD792_006454 [Penstemon davidsonii]|uniref:Exopolygalacturonase-like n=1 Tax=Penstemon davidsonii TaxID=160366 RepID=A0ABR0DDM9_9LAMI|nr:hypothetical protein RD792_006454 [Penstemon davidsonii]